MERINQILTHPRFLSALAENARAEIGRVHCKHDLSHALDVARIAYLLNLERGTGFSKELLYAAALLHDMTKGASAESGEAHNETAIAPASFILSEVGFSADEIAMICKAILHHRKGPLDGDVFACLIFQADKLSRPCFCCTAADSCHWSDARKNLELNY